MLLLIFVCVWLYNIKKKILEGIIIMIIMIESRPRQGNITIIKESEQEKLMYVATEKVNILSNDYR